MFKYERCKNVYILRDVRFSIKYLIFGRARTLNATYFAGDSTLRN